SRVPASTRPLTVRVTNPAGAFGTAGRASVGRARPVSDDAWGRPPADYDGPGGPGGPTGPGRTGRGAGGPDAIARAKKRKRLNLIIASFAVFIMMIGAGVVGFTYYSTNVVLPDDVPLPLSTTIFANDYKKVIAKLGEENRQFVTINQIPEFVQHEVASAEDRKFYEHSGVDYTGIARAAWNNFTGGSKQGASTITQQYARNAFANLQDDTYGRKIREAIMASKLNDKYDKNTIMQHYLNTIYFGRGAYGIEAAAQAYFGKSVSKLTVAEGAVLAGVIKQPVPDSATGHKGFDPAVNPEAAKDRWGYVLQGMVEKGWLKPEEKPTEYPTKSLIAPKAGNSMVGVDTPYGNVVNYVMQELAEQGLCVPGAEPKDGKPACRDAGFRIKTTIDPKMQDAAIAAARRGTKGSVMSTQQKDMMAALVAVQPGTGRVLAYYGGDSGAGFDYAGKNVDTAGNVTGGHPPGSSFKVYTLAAAINAGISTKSYWDSANYHVPNSKLVIRNANENFKASCGKSCTLEESTLKSFNVPFYHISEKIGPDKIVDTARDAGITTMWTSADNPPKAIDITKKSGKEVSPDPFFNVVSYGQYGVTVLDHANGMATFAARGKYAKAHFVLRVEKINENTGAWQAIPNSGEKLKLEQRIKPEVADNVTEVLKKYPKQINHGLDDNRPVTGKTGTWELDEKSNHNADAWMVGYTPQLATAVWVGNAGKRKALFTKSGGELYGANVPADVWQKFMNKALADQEIKKFPENVQIVGDDSAGDGVKPAPPSQENNPNSSCTIPIPGFCDNGGNNGGRNNGGGGNNNGGGGNNNGGGGFPGGTGAGVLPSTPPGRNQG
ncbi:transglycosylase domain-containing protein, partial [Micromonospora zhanjiangensis]